MYFLTHAHHGTNSIRGYGFDPKQILGPRVAGRRKLWSALPVLLGSSVNAMSTRLWMGSTGWMVVGDPQPSSQNEPDYVDGKEYGAPL